MNGAGGRWSRAGFAVHRTQKVVHGVAGKRPFGPAVLAMFLG
jgi:hypothetical protein